MKRRSTVFLVSFLFLMSASALFAASNAEKLYATSRDLDLNVASIDSIIKSYDALNDRIAKEATDAQKDMQKAASKGDADKYYAAYSRLATLSSYGIDEDATKALLARIVAEDEPAKKEHATWLYENSRYYSPSLSLDFSSSGEGFSYRYRQQVTQTPGTDITLPDGSQLQVNSQKLGILAGWGITKDSVTYKGGDTISMPYTNQTLYAIWHNGVQFTDSISKTNDFISEVKEGEEVQVPTPVAPDSSYLFAGWYDRTTGTLLTDEATYSLKGKAASFEALWRELSVEAVQPLYYAADKLPTQTQLSVGFSLKNGGTVALQGLQATMKTDSAYVTMIKDNLAVRSIPAGLQVTNNSWYPTVEQGTIEGEENTFRFVLAKDTPSGTVIPFMLEFSDNKGNTWSSSVSFTVK
ncbi:hypothetical protein SpiGrapes_1756 [Sphaerochaeta pleomorpha str. Grapes]|uniref:Repeat protein n=1 Tax=Sphaerochaeta pleomorpha (strain ATCC BAA-1885 / DSM 22778 / Grapes) TaxID=158190 RepID=G8QXJ0_SPHPG|nr:hypothetical protein [Sphaerochaeta pleomorpha]AEV29553.1 hypothetical protein SpiGrapes_1756 [Sphaerochaeta pleomorpha str. Grapes]